MEVLPIIYIQVAESRYMYWQARVCILKLSGIDEKQSYIQIPLSQKWEMLIIKHKNIYQSNNKYLLDITSLSMTDINVLFYILFTLLNFPVDVYIEV